jgi:hypothetical protein
VVLRDQQVLLEVLELLEKLLVKQLILQYLLVIYHGEVMPQQVRLK